MAMGTCRECGNQVSTEADKCPHCGVSMPTGASLAKKAAAGFGVGVVMLILIGMCNNTPTPSSSSSTTASTLGSTAVPTAHPSRAAEPAMAVDSATLFNAYQANEVAADDKFKGKILLVSGTVSEISKDMFDNIVVNLRTSNEFMSIHATMRDTAKSETAQLSKGDRVKVRCEGHGMIMGSPMLSDCTFGQ